MIEVTGVIEVIEEVQGGVVVNLIDQTMQVVFLGLDLSGWVHSVVVHLAVNLVDL